MSLNWCESVNRVLPASPTPSTDAAAMAATCSRDAVCGAGTLGWPAAPPKTTSATEAGSSMRIDVPVPVRKAHAEALCSTVKSGYPASPAATTAPLPGCVGATRANAIPPQALCTATQPDTDSSPSTSRKPSPSAASVSACSKSRREPPNKTNPLSVDAAALGLCTRAGTFTPGRTVGAVDRMP